MSIMLPDSSESTVSPVTVVISECSPRWIMPSSITPATSWPKRTQRVQWMQRLISCMAFTALVADGAIQRVVDQQELHDRLLGFDGLVALGAHDHALRHRRSARWHGLGSLFHIHQAHTAVGSDRKLLVVAEMRNVGARLLGRMHHHAAFGDFHFLTVQFNFNHMFSRDQTEVAACGALFRISASNSGRKCLIMARTGMAAASPSAQIVRPWMLSATELSRSRSPSRP